MKNGISSEEHRRQAEEEKGSIAFAIVTVSDTRTPGTDRSGQAIRQMAEASGHRVIATRIVRDEPEEVAEALEEFSGSGAQVIIFQWGHRASASEIAPMTCCPGRWRRNCQDSVRFSGCSVTRR